MKVVDIAAGSMTVGSTVVHLPGAPSVSVGFIDPPVRSSKIAIIGFASETMGFGPYSDPEFEIWILNMLHAHVPRWDRLWEMHDRATIEQESSEKEELRKAERGGFTHLSALQAERTRPIYMTEAQPDIPCSVRFPIEQLTTNGPFGKLCEKLERQPYFMSSFAYMLAWATMKIVERRVNQYIPEAGEEIHVCGVEMLNGEEYCVAPETKVLTTDLRWVQAADVVVGDSLMGFDEQPAPGKGGRRSWRRAGVIAGRTLRRPCYRLRMTDGTTLVSSAEHRWLTRGCGGVRWRRADQIAAHYRGGKPHGSPARIVKVIEPWGQPVHSWDAGYLAAAFDGEDWLTHIGSQGGGVRERMGLIGYSQRDNAMADTVKQALLKYGFGWRLESHTDTGDCRGYTITGGRLETLRFLGLMRPRRLLEKFDPDLVGRMHVGEARSDRPLTKPGLAPSGVQVESVEFIGEQEVVGLHTSTGTFVAEGFASHNSYQRSNAEFLLGYVLGLGIQLYIPGRSALLESDGMYGYAQPEAMELLARMRAYYEDKKKKGIAARDAAAMRRDQAKADWNTEDGGIQSLDWVLNHLRYLARGGKT